MEFLHSIWDGMKWLMDLRKHENLSALVNDVGVVWCYSILFAIIFSETGLLVGFFLPGDSLLFAAGFLSSDAVNHCFDLVTLNIILMIAAISGDALNYFIGLQMSEQVFEKGRLRFVKHQHLMAAKEFYERHGGKAIVLARFVPLVRTFTPFVAGVGRMGYLQFALYNVIGAVGWVLSMTLAGYTLGGFDFVKNNFEAVVIAIVVVSVLPVIWGAFKHWRENARKTAGATE